MAAVMTTKHQAAGQKVMGKYHHWKKGAKKKPTETTAAETGFFGRMVRKNA